MRLGDGFLMLPILLLLGSGCQTMVQARVEARFHPVREMADAALVSWEGEVSNDAFVRVYKEKANGRLELDPGERSFVEQTGEGFVLYRGLPKGRYQFELSTPKVDAERGALEASGKAPPALPRTETIILGARPADIGFVKDSDLGLDEPSLLECLPGHSFPLDVAALVTFPETWWPENTTEDRERQVLAVEMQEIVLASLRRVFGSALAACRPRDLDRVLESRKQLLEERRPKAPHTRIALPVWLDARILFVADLRLPGFDSPAQLSLRAYDLINVDQFRQYVPVPLVYEDHALMPTYQIPSPDLSDALVNNTDVLIGAATELLQGMFEDPIAMAYLKGVHDLGELTGKEEWEAAQQKLADLVWLPFFREESSAREAWPSFAFGEMSRGEWVARLRGDTMAASKREDLGVVESDGTNSRTKPPVKDLDTASSIEESPSAGNSQLLATDGHEKPDR